MATSMCPRCDGNEFEMAETSPKGSRWKFQFVQCASCGSVVGVLDYMNIGAMVADLGEELKRIARKVGA